MLRLTRPSARLATHTGSLCQLARRRLHVRVHADAVDPTIKIVTLNQPDSLNAMTVQLGEGMVEVVNSLRDLDPSELRAVVVTGAGRAFSAGGDLDFLEARHADTPTSNASVMNKFYRRFLGVRTLPVPVIACINGPAIGAGLCFAMGADIRITHDAAKVGFTFVGLGLHPGMGSTFTIAAASGGQTASRLLLTGDVISGAEAAKMGLVASSLADADAAMDESLAIARRIARQSPLAVRATVATLRAANDTSGVGLENALRREADSQAQSYATGDFAEGVAALKEKRKPVFKGE